MAAIARDRIRDLLVTLSVVLSTACLSVACDPVTLEKNPQGDGQPTVDGGPKTPPACLATSPEVVIDERHAAAMDVTAKGEVHIAYCSPQNHGTIKHVANGTGSWVTQTVDPKPKYQYSDIAVDRQGKVHSCFYDMDAMELMYATNASGSWTTITVDSGSVQSDFDVVVDSRDKVHIGYSVGSELRYATNASGSWSTTPVDVGKTTPKMKVAIAVDGDGKAHLSYIENPFSPFVNGALGYATNVSGAWVTKTLFSQGDVEGTTAIGVDGQGKVHIVFLEASAPMFSEDVIYATNASGAWTRRTVDNKLPASGIDPSLALDDSDGVHVVYSAYTELRYSTNASGSWARSKIDTGSWEFGRGSSIAIDGSGKIHVTYQGSIGIEYLSLCP
jgi:hypothetical protein